MFTEPASIRDIARALLVTEAVVKHHLVRLYGKFGIHDTEGRRGVRLANDALARGAISLTELASSDGAPGIGPITRAAPELLGPRPQLRRGDL